MKLLVNTATTFKGGSVQVAESFINECKKFNEHDYHVILGERIKQRIEKASFPDNFHFYDAPFRPATKVFTTAAADSFHKAIEEQCQPDVVFTTSGPAYWRSKAPHLIGFNLAHYLYPESAFFDRIPFHKKMKWKLKGLTINYFFKRDAEAYVVQTDDVNERLKSWVNNGRPVHTVTNTCSSYYFNPKKFPNKLPDNINQEFRFLTLSAYYGHKNIEVIKSVIAKLPDTSKKNIRFVLTLPSDIFQSLFTKEEQKYIHNVGPVPMEECASLYQECDAMFLPTLLECFSASYPEAMAMEKPIVTSDLGFARTVCADAAIYFDPIDSEDVTQKVIQLYQDQVLQKKLIAHGVKRLNVFDNPQSRARKYLEICQTLL